MPPLVDLVNNKPVSFTKFARISDGDDDAHRDLKCRTGEVFIDPFDLDIERLRQIFGPIIARLVNLSFIEGTFSEMFRVGQAAIPLLKKPSADTNDMPNFRPITNLNTIGKIW